VQGSRKDMRDAVRAARAAQPKWAGATAYLRGQVLYRVAEMMEGRAAQLADELRVLGTDGEAATREVTASIDRWVWYAGWADKIAPIAGTVNPVAGPYFDFTVPEPVGVVGVVARRSPLLGLVSLSLRASGNAVVASAGNEPAVASRRGDPRTSDPCRRRERLTGRSRRSARGSPAESIRSTSPARRPVSRSRWNRPRPTT
jgi:acyl-CoA reductase-like NAD-dependent aldehyde dehydrogenase